MTLKRIRVYSVLLAAVTWSVWLIDFSNSGVIDRLGKIKGTDFLQFYVGGSLIREGRADLLYDFPTQFARLQAIASGSPDTIYVPVQSPQTALAFAPLTGHGYGVALAAWIALIVLLYAAACWISWRQCTALRGYPTEIVACCAAFPAFSSTVLHGQTSCIGLLAVSVAIAALRHGNRFAAGVAVGTLVFKPHWAAAAWLIFLAAREWRVIAGLVLAAAAQISVTCAAVGPAVMNAYFRTLMSLSRIAEFLEPRPSTTLHGLFAAIVPSASGALVLYLAASSVTVVATAKLWRSGERFDVRASAIILAMILISPHAFEYDLILLTPAFFLLANRIAKSPDDRHVRALAFGLCALFIAPMLIGAPALIRLQFSVTAMSFLLFTLSRNHFRPLQPAPSAA